MQQVEEVAVAFMEWGRWIARCPRQVLGCSNAEHYGPDPVTQHVGGLTTSGFRCAHCRLECPSKWPAERAGIEAALAMRPIPATRNWLPGEDLATLLAENIEHGLVRV